MESERKVDCKGKLIRERCCYEQAGCDVHAYVCLSVCILQPMQLFLYNNWKPTCLPQHIITKFVSELAGPFPLGGALIPNIASNMCQKPAEMSWNGAIGIMFKEVKTFKHNMGVFIVSIHTSDSFDILNSHLFLGSIVMSAIITVGRNCNIWYTYVCLVLNWLNSQPKEICQS